MERPNAPRLVSAGRLADRRAARSVVTAVVALGCLYACGCIQASLATSTGPNGAGEWSIENQQQVHIGEVVDYSFILLYRTLGRPVDPYEYADYVVVTIGEERLQCEPDSAGRFRFSYRLAGIEPGEKVKVTATAYRQHGQRDFMKIGDTWLRGDSPYDEPDRARESDTVTLKVYEAVVEIMLPEGQAPFDFESGKLEFIKHDGTIVPIYIDRPTRRGFTTVGPDRQGQHTIVYVPDGDQLNPSGVTEARFTVYDRAGHQHTAGVTIPTP